jgi:hypothetical protein
VVAGSEKEFSVDSWGIGIGAKVPIGPFYVNAAFQYLQNPGNYGFAQNAPVALAAIVGDGVPANQSDVEDIDVWTGAIVLGFNLTSTLSFEGGWFHIDASTNSSANLTPGYAFGLDVNAQLDAYYIMATWSPAKNVFIVPEIGIVDFNSLEVDGSADDDLGDMLYIGIKWMINF